MIKNIFKEIKIPLFFLSLLFCFSLWLGYMSGNENMGEAREIFLRLSKSFIFLKEINIFAIFLFIFFNNTIKVFVVTALGMFFGIIPILFVAINGLLIGIMSSVILEDHGVSYLLAGTIPHGILEIPAFLVASSYGLILAKKYYRKLKYREPFKPHFFRIGKKMVRYVLPILAAASFVETFITMAILRSM